MPRLSRFRSSRNHSAFTLVELLAIVTVIMILLGVGAVGIRSYNRVTGRKSAVSQLMGEIANARALSLSHGGGIFLVFAGRNAPERYAFRAYATFRDEGKGGNLVQLSAWTLLPEGILLKEGAGSLMEESASPLPPFFTFPNADAPVPCPYIAFNSRGGVRSPVDPSRLRIVLCEGAREEGKEIVTAWDGEGKALTEEIVISRLTGIARHPET